jgi:hypothetical protein
MGRVRPLAVQTPRKLAGTNKPPRTNPARFPLPLKARSARIKKGAALIIGLQGMATPSGRGFIDGIGGDGQQHGGSLHVEDSGAAEGPRRPATAS